MRTRHKKLSDYGISDDRSKELYMICKMGDESKKELLQQAADATCDAVLSKLIFRSLSEGQSYEAISRGTYIPIGKNDFYAYRRKTLARLDELLREKEN